MKKLIKAFLTVFAVMLVSLCVNAETAKPDITVMLDGEEIDCVSYGQGAVIQQGRTLVPLRAIFEALGATVEWDQTTKTVTSTLDETTVKLTIGKSELVKNGETVVIDVAAQIMNSRTVVPVRAVAEAYGVDVEWDSKTRTVILTSPGGYKKGVIQQGVYSSEWLGIDFVLPEGYVFASEEYLDRLVQTAEDITLDEMQEDAVNFCEFMATGEGKGSVTLSSQRNTEYYGITDFLNFSVKDSFEKMNAVYELSEIYELKLAEISLLAVDARITMFGTEYTVTTAVFEKDSRYVMLVVTCFDEAEINNVLEGFGQIKRDDIQNP